MKNASKRRRMSDTRRLKSNIIRNQNGITMITLAVTIILLAILTFTVVINLAPYGNEKRRAAFESDLKSLKEQVDQYYARYGELPVKKDAGGNEVEYNNSSEEFNKILEEKNWNVINVNDRVSDSEDGALAPYYVLDTDLLDVDLNYKDETFIINSQSHTVYLPEGVTYAEGVDDDYNEDAVHYRISEVYTVVSGDQADQEAPDIIAVGDTVAGKKKNLKFSDITSKSFKITAKAQDTDSGLYKIVFHYRKDDEATYRTPETIEYILPRNTNDVPADKQQGTKVAIEATVQTPKTLRTGGYWVYIDVYDMAGNKTTFESDPEYVEVPPVDPIGDASLSTTDWTNQNVTVTLPVAPVQFATSDKNYKKEFITQYFREGIDTEWQTYFNPATDTYDPENPPTIEIDKLTTLKYRYFDEINAGPERTVQINKIDKEPPTVDVDTSTITTVDGYKEVIYGEDIVVSVRDIENIAEGIYGSSGVKQWQVNQNSTAPTTDEEWDNLPEENNLTPAQTNESISSTGHVITIVQKANPNSYLDVGTYYVWAKDKAGNVNAKDEQGNINENINGANLLIAKIVINPKSIQGFTITLNPTEYDYDGTAKEPTVTVKDGEIPLNGVKEGEDTTGKDFTYRYENNINAGTARVIITGINNYTGVEDSATFIINKAEPTLTVEIEGTNSYKETLTANATTNSDGEVTYQWWYSENADGSNLQVLTGETNQTYVVGSGLVGKYIGVTVNVGTGTNYYATGKQDITDISNTTAPVEPRDGETHFTVTLIPTEYTYDGQAKEPTIVVKDGETTLIGVREGEDTTGKAFTYRYENNVNAGTATVVITGINDYKGTVNKNFTINKANPEVTVTITGKNINGQTLTANSETESDGQKTYQWWYSEQADGSDKQPIPGATDQTYTLDDTYLDKYIWVTVSVAENTNYNAASGQDITDAQNNLSPTVIDIYTITLDNGEATTPGSTAIYETYSVNYTLTKNGAIMTTTENPITPPTKTGYTFGGYYTEANGAGTQYINEAGFLTSSADNRHFEAEGTLYAKWTAHTYTVDFYPNLQGRLPIQYQEVEYIQNTAADAYINTGVTPTNTLKTEIVYTDVAASGSNYVLGSRTGSGGSIIYYGIVGNQADKSIGAYYNSTAQNKFPITRKANEKYDAILEIQHDEENGYRMHSTLKDVTANNSYEQYSTYQAEGLTGTPPNLYVFAIKPDQRHQGMKLHSLQFWDTSTGEPTLIRDFVPCYRISDDKIGLYDLVNDEFHEGVGSFTKGENVTIDFEKQTQQFTYGVSQNLRANTFTRTGYNFTGWNTKQDGSGTDYADEQEVSNLTAENGGRVELYAQWEVNHYVVKFNANEGTGTMEDMNFTYGVSQNLRTNTFTRAGYTFTGWNTEANGTGASYLNNEEVKNLTAINNAEVTLYAQWSINKYSIEFNYPLPSEYQQVEYIESTGNAYIDTGIAPTNTLKTEMTYMDTAAVDSNYVLGSRIGEAGSEIYYGLVGNSGDLSIGAYYNSNSPRNFPVTRVQNEKYHVILDLEHDAQKGYRMVATLDDITANTSYNVQTTYYQNGITETVPNIYVFGIKEDQLHKGMRLYQLKFYDNGVLIRNYIPCYRVADGTIGLYDMVEGGFYTHENLSKGPDEANEYHEKRNQQFEYNTAQNLLKNTYEREGYNFSGWNTNQNGTGTHYDDEQEVINLTAVNGEIINFYVQWEEIKATNIILDKETVNLVYGDTTTITGTIEPSDTLNKTLNWTTSDSTVCSVSSSTSTSGNPITITANKAGTAIITATSTDGSNISKTCTVTVAPKDVTVNWGEQDSWQYDGNEHMPTATTTIEGINGETITITITGAQTNVGTHNATATITSVTKANGDPGDVSNYNLTNPTKEFTITAGEITGSVTITGENTYGNTLTAEVSNLNPADAGLTYQWYYSDNEGTTGGTAIDGATSSTYTIGEGLVGKHIYVVVTASKENYETTTFKDDTDTTNNRTDTVAPKQITPPTPVDKTYNGLEQTSFEGTADYIVTGNTGTNAGNYEATAVLRDKENTVWADNNRTTDKTLSWIIEPAEITVTWGETTTWTYDGEQYAPTVTSPITGVNGETLTIAVSGAQTNVGDYTATASIASVTKANSEAGNAENYTIANPTQSFTITNASITGEFKITGTNTVGATLTATKVSLNPDDANLSYQWYVSDTEGTTGGTPIAGATNQQYTLTENEVGKHIYVVVTASKENYETTTFADDTDATENVSATVFKIVVTLNPNGGTVDPTSVEVAYNSAYGTLPTPTRTGYTFDGWYTESTNGTKVEGTTTVTTANAHTLYAQWTANTYEATFEPNGGNLRRLPSEYQEVEYIQSSGTQYIDTGFRPNQDTRIIMDFQYTQNNQGYRFTGSEQLNPNSKAFRFGSSGSGNWLIGYGSQGLKYAGSHDTERHTIDFNKNNVILDNETLYEFSYETFTSYGNAYIFSINSNSIADLAPAKLYYLKIYNNDVLIRDYIPCYRISDNEIGLYDTVNNVFYTNQGTGTLIKGSDVTGTNTEVMSNQQFVYDVAQNLTANAYTKEGYTFAGWNTEANGSGTSYADEQEVSNLTAVNEGVVALYAQWEANTYTVTANANGGTIPETEGWTVGSGSQTATKMVTFDSTYGTLPTPERTGYTFDGWYTAEIGGTQVESSTTVTTAGNHTIHAHWTANTYTVTANANGGTIPETTGWTVSSGNETATKTVTFDSTYGTLPIPTREGYTFDGWYTAETGGTQVEGTTTVATADAHTLYAHWTANDYTVTFNSKGGSVDPTSKSVTYDSPYGTLPTPTRTGYTFNGWYTEETNGTKVEEATIVKTPSDHTLYAVWQANDYTVTANANGGTIPETEGWTVASGSETATKDVTFDDTYGTLPTPTRTGYTFDGWYTEATNGTEVEVSTVVTTAGNHTIYAHWTANTYEVAFEPNGGGLSNRLPEGYQEVEYIQSSGTQYINTMVYPKSTTKVIYDFAYIGEPNGSHQRCGWGSGGNQEAFQWGVLNSGEFYSIVDSGWQRRDTGTSFDNNRHTFVLESGKQQFDGKIYGTTTIGNTATSTEYMYFFAAHVEWDNAANCATNQKLYAAQIYDGQTLVRDFVPCYRTSDNVIGLYDTVNNVFYTNQGTGTFTKGPNVETMPNQHFVYDVAQNLIPNEYSKKGYTFAGWNTEANGSGTSYTDEQEVSNLTAVNEGTATLYAQWTANNYTVTANANGGTIPETEGWTVASGSETATKDVTFDGTYGTLPTPTKTGYTFDGWYTEQAGGTKVETSTIVTTADAHTVYAHWQANTYEVAFEPNIGTLSSRLPAGYQEVEYIQSSGTQYIDTGVKSDNGYTINTDIVFTDFSKDLSIITGSYAMSGGSSSNDEARYYLRIDKNTGYLHYQYNSAEKYGGVNLQLNTKYNIECKLTKNSQYLKLNNNLITSTTINADQSKIDLKFLGIMGNNGNEVTVGNICYAKAYSCKYYDNNDNLVRNFIPCYSTTTVTDVDSISRPAGTIGMYDTVNGKFYVNKGTGTFEKGADVEKMPNQQFVYDTAQNLTANTYTKEGYTFAGWNTEANGSGTAYTDEQEVINLTAVNEGTVTLYAHWIANTYDVVFRKNENQTELPNEYQEVEYIESSGTQYINTGIYPKSTTKVVYDFASNGENPGTSGWGSSGGAESFMWGVSGGKYYSSVSTTWSSLRSDISVDNNRHIFALESGQQQIDGVTYATSTIGNTATSTQYMYFFATHTEWDDAASYSGSQKLYGAQIYDGQTLVRNFVPCYRTSDNEIGLYDTVNNVFYTNQGTGTFEKGANVEKMPNQHFVYDVAQNLTANTYTKEGYTFAGWNTNPNGSGTAYTDEQEVSNLTTVDGGIVMLYAQWEANTYEVAFEPNGGSLNSRLPAGYQEVEYIESTGTQYILLDLTYSINFEINCTFQLTELRNTYQTVMGQDTCDVRVDGNGYLRGITTLPYVGLTKHNCKIIANKNNNQRIITLDGETYTHTNSFESNGKCAIFTNSAVIDSRKAKARFYSGNVYLNNELRANLIPCYSTTTVTNANGNQCPSGTIGLYDTVTGKFYTNQGTGTFVKGSDVEKMPNQQFVYDVAQNLTANNYAKEGYTFAGWNTEANGSGTAYTDEQEVINLTAVNEGTVTLYAQWTANTYEVAFEPNDGKLPNEYQKVEYIESTGTQYIDTQVYMDENKSFEIKFKYNNNDSIGLLVGAYDGNVNANALSNWNKKFSTHTNAGYHLRNEDADLNIHTVKWNIQKGKANIDNENPINLDPLGNCENSWYLFASNYNAGPNFLSNTRVYYMKIFDNGTLIRDFVPCYRTSDNVIGLYDTVNNVFYTNKGTGTFNKGNDVNENTSTNEKMPNQHFVYDVAQNLTPNTYTKTGYSFAGWNGLIYSNNEEKNNKNDSWNDAREFIQYADLAPYFDKYGLDATYRLELDLKSEKTTNENKILIYFQNGSTSKYQFVQTKSIQVSSTEWTHVDFDFKIKNQNDEQKAILAFYGTYNTGNNPVVKNVRLSVVPQLTDEQLVSNLTTENNGVVNLFAMWEANNYTIHYHNNGTEIGTSSHTYNVEQNLKTITELGATETGYEFAGWATADNTIAVTYTDGQSISNLTEIAGGTVDLHAVWQRQAHFHSGSEGEVTNVTQYKNGATCSVEPPTPIAIDTWTAQYWRAESKEVHYPLAETITANVGPDFYAVYTRNVDLEYNEHFAADIVVTFDAGEGTVNTANKLVVYNSPYGNLPTPTRAGYAFDGWYTGENGEGTKVTSDTLVAQNTNHTLHAKWIIGVNYYNGSTLVASSAYTNGAESNLTTAEALGITEPGYTNFYGWATSNNTVQRTYTDGQSIDEIVTNGGTIDLYAVWSRTANFYSGSEATVTTAVQYKNGETCSVEPPTPIAINTWQPQYWRTESKDEQYPIAETITNNVGPNFYAVYARDINLEYNDHFATDIRVSFNAGGGNVSTASKLVAYNNIYGELPIPTKEGQVFAGWFTGENGTGTQVTAETTVTENADHTLYAKWTIEVNYYNGETLIATSAYTSGAGNTLATAEELEITEPGYTNFYGWAIANNSLERAYTDGQAIDEIVTNGGTINLYAVWTRTANFYSGENKTLEIVAQYKNGATCSVEPPTPIEVENWEVQYWRAEDKDVHYPLGETITANVGPDFYAVYSRDVNLEYNDHFEANITVSFNAGEGTVETSSKSVAYNNIYGALPTPTRAGYVFNGWYTGENGTGTEVTAQTTVAQNTNHTLYAKWVIGVNYHNGSELIDTTTYTNGTENNLASAEELGIQDDNYTDFYGWATSDNTLERTFTDEQAISEVTTNDGIVDLYAIWSRTANFYSGENKTLQTATQYKNGDTYSVEVPTPIEVENWEVQYWRAENKDVHYPLGETITANVGPNFYAVYSRDVNLEYNDHFEADITVSFNAGEGIVETSSKSVAYNNIYGALPTPTREGYLFKGWYTGENGTGTMVTPTTTVSNTNAHTLYAKWIESSFTLTLDGNGATIPEGTDWTLGIGNETAEKTVIYEDVYGTLPNPTITGYTFDGWFTQETGGTRIDEITTVLFEGDHTLYAHWTARQYTVTFEPNGGAVYLTEEEVTFDSAYNTLPTPTRTGYTFNGWYTEEVEGTQVEEATILTRAEDHTLYAHWTANTYTVTANANGGTIPTTENWTNASGDETSTKTVTYDGTYGNLPTPTRTGYTFSGWYTEETTGTEISSVTTVAIANNHTLYAHWTANTYEVTFNTTGGTAFITRKDVTFDSAYDTLPIPTKDGYTFDGWFTEETEGTQVEENTIVSRTEDHTLYAHWTVITYTVAFETNGGVLRNLPSEYQEVEYIESTGTQYINTGVYPKSTTKVIYDFAFTGEYTESTQRCGWGSSATQEAFLWGVVSNSFQSTVDSKWQWSDTAVPFDNNRHTFILASGNQQFDGVTYGTTTIGNTATSTQYMYFFAGHVEWGNNAIYVCNQKLYAAQIYDGETLIRNFVPCYRISDDVRGLYDTVNNVFYTNQGSGTFTKGPNVETMPNQHFVYDVAQNLTANTYTKEGYTFAGWNTEANGSGTSYTNQQEVSNLTTQNNGTVTLYAQWQANEYTVTVNANEGTIPEEENWTNASGNITATKTVTYDSTYGNLPTPTRTGYTFNGWYTEETEGTQVEGTTIVTRTEDHTLYAHWTINQYEITWLSGNLMTGKNLGNDGCTTLTNNNGVYTVTTNSEWGGAYIAPENFTVGKTYILSYKIQKTAGTLLNIAGHCQSVTQRAFTIDGNNVSTHYSDTASNITNDTNIHNVVFEFTYNGNASNNSVYIKPNRGSAQSVTVKISELELYEVVKTEQKNYGTTIQQLPTVSRTGCMFNGWYTDKVGGTKVTETTLVPTENTTYYTHWNVNLMFGKQLENVSGTAVTNNNGVYTVTTDGAYEGIYIPANNFVVGKTYRLSYKIQKTAGTLLNIAGHCQSVTQREFTIDGNNVSTDYSSSASNITDDTNVHNIELEFVYNGNVYDNNIYIQPNRGSAQSVTVKLSELELYEIVETE